jgi:tetratricopeptide (TPR) repeat protein
VLPAGLGSGLDGLEQLGSRWEQKAPERAAAVFAELHRLAPASAGRAFQAGKSASELALALAERGRAACKRGARAEAEALFARAREQMELGYRAYQDAVALRPADAGLLNECALILVYHLQRDPDEAERLLRRAIELGERELPDLARAAAEEGLEAEEKSRRQLAQQELVSAVGDAKQNLGVLYLTLRGDAQGALPFLEACRGMGPDPRLEVSGPGGYLEQAHTALAGKLDPRVTDQTRWPEPCKDK